MGYVWRRALVGACSMSSRSCSSVRRDCALPSVPLAGQTTRALAVLAVFAVLVFIVLPRLEKQIQRLLARIMGATPLQGRLSGLLQQFLLGMRAFQHLTRGAGFAGLTCVIWLADSLAMLLVARAFDLTLALPQALVLIAALGLSSAAPSSRSGIYGLCVAGSQGFARKRWRHSRGSGGIVCGGDRVGHARPLVPGRADFGARPHRICGGGSGDVIRVTLCLCSVGR
jgi:hypothetical protein